MKQRLAIATAIITPVPILLLAILQMADILGAKCMQLLCLQLLLTHEDPMAKPLRSRYLSLQIITTSSDARLIQQESSAGCLGLSSKSQYLKSIDLLFSLHPRASLEKTSHGLLRAVTIKRRQQVPSSKDNLLQHYFTRTTEKCFNRTNATPVPKMNATVQNTPSSTPNPFTPSASVHDASSLAFVVVVVYFLSYIQTNIASTSSLSKIGDLDIDYVIGLLESLQSWQQLDLGIIVSQLIRHSIPARKRQTNMYLSTKRHSNLLVIVQLPKVFVLPVILNTSQVVRQ